MIVIGIKVLFVNIGKKAGYVFRNDEVLGIGYHLDKTNDVSSELVKESEIVNNVATNKQSEYYAPFSYDFRQLPHCISIVVNVAHINSSSVDIKYDKNVVSVRFTAMEAKDSNMGVEYGMIFECPGEVMPDKSTFNVASGNMALVLMKSVPVMWLFKSASAASGGVTVSDTVILKEKQILENSILTIRLFPIVNFVKTTKDDDQQKPNPTVDIIPLVKLASPPVSINGNSDVLKYVETQYNQLTFSNTQVLYELD